MVLLLICGEWEAKNVPGIENGELERFCVFQNVCSPTVSAQNEVQGRWLVNVPPDRSQHIQHLG